MIEVYDTTTLENILQIFERYVLPKRSNGQIPRDVTRNTPKSAFFPFWHIDCRNYLDLLNYAHAKTIFTAYSPCLRRFCGGVFYAQNCANTPSVTAAFVDDSAATDGNPNDAFTRRYSC